MKNDTALNEIRKSQTALRERIHTAEDKLLVAPVHKIATQFYCEQQVDFARTYGDRENQEMVAGSEGHEAAIEHAQETTWDELWTKIEEQSDIHPIEMSLYGHTESVHLIGRPDYIAFRNHIPRIIIERKFSNAPDRVFNNETFQAWLYCYLLDEMGFSIDQLTYVVVKVPRSRTPDAPLLQLTDQLVVEQVLADSAKSPFQPLPDEPIQAHPSLYTRQSHFEDLQWALEYWREERDPIPTSNAAKCRPCDFVDDCEKSPLTKSP